VDGDTGGESEKEKLRVGLGVGLGRPTGNIAYIGDAVGSGQGKGRRERKENCESFIFFSYFAIGFRADLRALV
jgi:hypothetical protein